MTERAEIERDIWTRMFEVSKRDYIEQGLTEEQADEKASADIRKAIRGVNSAPG